MACKCPKLPRASLWTPIPDAQQRAAVRAIESGENIDCYMKSAGDKESPDDTIDNVAEKPPCKISNTSLTSDLNANVGEQFKITSCDKTAQLWRVSFNGADGIPPGMGLSFDSGTGLLSGTVADSFLNKNYEVEVKAFDGNPGELIDSRKFNFFPKAKEKSEPGTALKFVFPYSPNGRITSPFGPRTSPTSGASKNHKGIDISQPGSARGKILAAGDGEVIRAGPASGWGNVIFIQHKDSSGKVVATTVYGHMNEWYVKVGQKVSAGQVIAEEGNSGVGTAAHLHFEFHKGTFGNPVDPVAYLNGKFDAAEDNLPGQANTPDPAKIVQKDQSNQGMTTKESQSSAPC